MGNLLDDLNDPVDHLDPEDRERILAMQKEAERDIDPRVKKWRWLLGKRFVGQLDVSADSNQSLEDVQTPSLVEPLQEEEQGVASTVDFDRGLPDPTRVPNVVISRTEEDPDEHYPLIDLDLDCFLIPSSTTGHAHLYINQRVTTAQYQAILDAFVAAGIVQRGFARRLKVDGYCTFRLPWVQKEEREVITAGDGITVADPF